MNGASLVALLLTIYGDPQVRVLVLLSLANVVVGIARAILPTNQEQFRLAKLADWLRTVLVWMMGYGAVYLLTLAQPGLQLGGLTPKDAAFGAIVAALVGYVIQNVRESGVPLPEVLGGRSKVLGTDPIPAAELAYLEPIVERKAIVQVTGTGSLGGRQPD